MTQFSRKCIKFLVANRSFLNSSNFRQNNPQTTNPSPSQMVTNPLTDIQHSEDNKIFAYFLSKQQQKNIQIKDVFTNFN